MTQHDTFSASIVSQDQIDAGIRRAHKERSEAFFGLIKDAFGRRFRAQDGANA